jgi:hypothetical protein
MPANYVQQPIQTVTITSTSITLGYLPNETPPPEELVIWAASACTVTLPPIATTLPSNTNTNFQVGSQSMKIGIKSLTGQVINISGSQVTFDKIWDGQPVISSSGAHITFLGSLSDGAWYTV